MLFTEKVWGIFTQSVEDYHRVDSVDSSEPNPYPEESLERVLYSKNWVDTVQWHLEDLIRERDIDPVRALSIKRKIDDLNQRRTDLVEGVDLYFFKKYRGLIPKVGAKINTETPAWAIDRLSILCLKIYHMRQEVGRQCAGEAHRRICADRLEVLQEQKEDLCTAIEELFRAIEEGSVRIKVYRQMKMYNDETMNPVLYKKSDRAESLK